MAAHIDQFPTLRSQRDLIESIPGIGATTAAIVLGELLDIQRFTGVRQMAAFAGLVPQIVQSGTSVRGRGRLTPHGARGSARPSIFRPSVRSAAIRFSAALRRRLRAAGKPQMVIITAVMRKLLHQIFGVLRSRRAYDPLKA